MQNAHNKREILTEKWEVLEKQDFPPESGNVDIYGTETI